MVATYIIGKDPDWQRQMNERYGRALTTMLSMMENEKEKREKEKMRDLQMLQSDPRLAEGEFGRAFAEKYPDAAPIASHLAEIGRKARLGEEAVQSMYKGANAEQAMRQAEFQRTQQLDPFGQGLEGPLSPQAIAQERGLARVNQGISNAFEGSPEWVGRSQLDPERQMLADQWLRQQRLQPPTGPDLSGGEDLAQDALSGLTPQQILERRLVKSDLIPGAGERLTRQTAQDRMSAAVDRQTTQIEAAKALENQRHDHRVSEIRSKADARANGSPAKQADLDEFTRAVETNAASVESAVAKAAEGKAPPPRIKATPPIEARTKVASILGGIGKSGFYNGQVAWMNWEKLFTEKELMLATPTYESKVEAWILWAKDQAGLLDIPTKKTMAP